MSENQQTVPEEVTTNSPDQPNSLFTEPEENLNISSGKGEQTKSQVKIETNIVNQVVNFMLAKSQAWSSMEQAFIHFSILFMNRDWHGENDLANKINESFKDAPFTVARTKQCLDNLSKVGVLNTKTVKGKKKYMLTDMGISMIMHDRVLAKVLGFEQPDTTEQASKQESQPQNVQTSATLEGNTAAATDGKLIVGEAEPAAEGAPIQEQI